MYCIIRTTLSYHTGCPELRTTISLPNNATDKCIHTLYTYNKYIEKIEIYNNTNITDYAISQLFRANKGLKEVNIQNCYNITDLAIYTLLYYNRGVIILTIHSTRLTDMSLLHICTYAVNLTKLDIQGIKVYDILLILLSRRCFKLNMLFISHCIGVTVTGLIGTILNIILCHNIYMLYILLLCLYMRARLSGSEFGLWPRDPNHSMPACLFTINAFL